MDILKRIAHEVFISIDIRVLWTKVPHVPVTQREGESDSAFAFRVFDQAMAGA